MFGIFYHVILVPCINCFFCLFPQMLLLFSMLKGVVFVINCEIVKLQTMHGWMYEGCSKCGSKPRVQDSFVMCGICKKKLECIEPK